MRCKSMWINMLCMVMMAFCTGCEPPNHLDSPAAGGDMYFAMGVLPRYQIGQGSQLYVFDVEQCRLRMLSDAHGMNTWVSGSPDGKEFAYTRCHSQSHFTLHVQRVGDKNARQLGAAHKAYAAPRYVPGKSPHILAYTGRTLGALDWVLFDASGRELAMPFDGKLKAVGTDSPAVAANKVAVPVYGMIKEYWKTKQKPWGVRIYVVDLAGGKPVATEAALFDVHHHQTQRNFLNNPTIDLGFSPDATKLVMAWAGTPETKFYELDATGKKPAKELFTDKNAYAPEYMSDGRSIVYLRKHRIKWNRLEVMLWKPGNEPKVILEVCGQPRGSAGCVFRRRPDGKMRLLQFTNSGVGIVDFTAAGAKVSDRFIDTRVLGTQRTLARFEFVFKRNRKTNQYVAPYEVMKHFYKMKKLKNEAREDQVARALDIAWKDARKWGADASTEVATHTPVASTRTASAAVQPKPETAPTVVAPAPAAKGKWVNCPHCGKKVFVPE